MISYIGTRSILLKEGDVGNQFGAIAYSSCFVNPEGMKSKDRFNRI